MRIPYQWVIVGTRWVSHAVYFLNYMTVGTQAPLIRSEFRLTSAEIGLLCSAVTIGSMVSQIPAGVLNDSFGVKWVMISGLLMPVMVGAEIGANQTSGSKAIIMWFPFKGRATAMGIKQTGVTKGGALAAFALPIIALHFNGWRFGFLVAGLLALGAAGLIVTLYREARFQSVEPPHPSVPWKSHMIRISLDKTFLLLSGAGVLLMIIQFSFDAHFVLYATSVLHVSVDQAGTLLRISFIAGVFGRIGLSVSSDYFFRTR